MALQKFSEELIWSLRPGTRLAVVGHNACGKSTLLKAIGYRMYDSGSIFIDGNRLGLLNSQSVGILNQSSRVETYNRNYAMTEVREQYVIDTGEFFTAEIEKKARSLMVEMDIPTQTHMSAFFMWSS